MRSLNSNFKDLGWGEGEVGDGDTLKEELRGRERGRGRGDWKEIKENKEASTGLK